MAAISARSGAGASAASESAELAAKRISRSVVGGGKYSAGENVGEGEGRKVSSAPSPKRERVRPWRMREREAADDISDARLNAASSQAPVRSRKNANVQTK